jgi:hypothetical protein
MKLSWVYLYHRPGNLCRIKMNSRRGTSGDAFTVHMNLNAATRVGQSDLTFQLLGVVHRLSEAHVNAQSARSSVAYQCVPSVKQPSL